MTEGLDFRRVFQDAPEVRLLLSEASIVLDASDRYLDANGITRAQLIGQSVFDLHPYKSAPRARELLRAALGTLHHSGVATPLDLPDATPSFSGAQWLGATNVPIRDGAGKLLCVRHELHARPASGSVSPAREAELGKLFESSDEVLALVDGYGRFSFVTPSIQHVLGYTEQQFIDGPPMAFVHPEDAPRFGEELNVLLAAAGRRIMLRGRLRAVDGSWRTIEGMCVNRLHDPDVAAVIVTLRDVTEQVELQDELVRSHEQLRVALSAARAIPWVWDLVTNRWEYSGDVGAFFHLASARLDGLDASAAVHPGDREATLAQAQRCLQTAEDFHVEFRGLPSDSEPASPPRWYASHGQVVRDAAGSAPRMLGVTWDISERKRWEHEREVLDRRVQESQKLESLGVLAGGIAHDFNNILMAILGYASLTRSALRKDSTALGHVVQIEEASRRAAELCRQMLAYAGKGRFVLAVTDLNRLIEETAHLLQVSISKKAVLRIHLHATLPPTVADATQLRQVLMNLVINASDAIGDRSGVISISTGLVRVDRTYLAETFLAPEIPEGDYVYLEVSDTGGGMTPEIRARIFEPFFSTKFTGRGLGLAAVLGIVRGHRGALKVYSEPGRGSSFKFLLPVVHEPAERRSPGVIEGAPLSARGTILVVDDEETVRAVSGRMLEALGLSVLTASDGREAVERYREHQGQIIAVLMDLTMPHLDGEEAFRELRRLNPEVRVLLMSGYNEQDAIARFVGKGLAGFVQKPFSLDELRERLRVLLGG